MAAGAKIHIRHEGFVKWSEGVPLNCNQAEADSVLMQVFIKSPEGAISWMAKTVALPFGNEIQAELPFLTEGPKHIQDGGNSIISVPTSTLGFKG